MRPKSGRRNRAGDEDSQFHVVAASRLRDVRRRDERGCVVLDEHLNVHVRPVTTLAALAGPHERRDIRRDRGEVGKRVGAGPVGSCDLEQEANVDAVLAASIESLDDVGDIASGVRR